VIEARYMSWRPSATRRREKLPPTQQEAAKLQEIACAVLRCAGAALRCGVLGWAV
jgi:hypothetical protein